MSGAIKQPLLHVQSPPEHCHHHPSSPRQIWIGILMSINYIMIISTAVRIGKPTHTGCCDLLITLLRHFLWRQFWCWFWCWWCCWWWWEGRTSWAFWKFNEQSWCFLQSMSILPTFNTATYLYLFQRQSRLKKGCKVFFLQEKTCVLRPPQFCVPLDKSTGNDSSFLFHWIITRLQPNILSEQPWLQKSKCISEMTLQF